jgi:hypothetical protein
MKKLFALTITLLMLSACSTMQPPRYAVSVDNIQQLKTFKGAKTEMVSLTQPERISVNCRLMGPVEPADGLSYAQFISKAFNDEFKMADIHSTDGTKITGSITKVKFSSTTGLTSGYWDIGLELKSSNGESLASENKYSFKSGFDAITACNATADALSPAVQDLIKATINDPKFKLLVE